VKPNERAAVITYRLSQGGTVTAAQVAEWCQVSLSTTYRDLRALERVIPLARDNRGGIFIVSSK